MPKLGSPLVRLFRLPARLRAFFWGFPGWLRRHWRPRSIDQVDRLISFAGVMVAAIWFVGLLVAHIKLVAQAGPQEYNEPAIWQTTWLLDHGRNPYSLDELPGSTYCFGPLYNYVVIALKPLLGIDYAAHRVVALAFLLLSLAVMASAMRRAGAGLGVALLSVVFYYWMSLGNIEITARPDTLGLFFFLLGILVPWNRGYTVGSSVAGLLCAVVAFNCKSYFAVAGCATLLVHFLARDRREACWLGVFFFALVGLTFAISCYVYPYFYILTVIVQRGGALINERDDISIMHTVILLERGWPFFLIMICGAGAWLWRRQKRGRENSPATGAAAEASREGMALLALSSVFVIFLAVVYFSMGRNAGAFFTYHLHLLFPLMFVLSAHALRARWLRMVSGVVLIGFFLNQVVIPDVPDAAAAYHRMEEIVRTTPGDILGLACTADIFARNGRAVIHNGNTMFLGFAFAGDRAERDPKVAALAAKLDAVSSAVLANVADRKYAIILSEFDDPYFISPDLLRQNYDKVEQIDYYTYFGHSPVRVWKPKPVGSGAGSKGQGAGSP